MMRSNKQKPMDRETFMQQYILNRALSGGDLSNTTKPYDRGKYLSWEAEGAWNEIKKELR